MLFKTVYRSAIFRIFKVLKIALIRAKTPTFSTNIVGACFTQLLKKTKIFLEEELDVDSSDDVSVFCFFLSNIFIKVDCHSFSHYKSSLFGWRNFFLSPTNFFCL